MVNNLAANFTTKLSDEWRELATFNIINPFLQFPDGTKYRYKLTLSTAEGGNFVLLRDVWSILEVKILTIEALWLSTVWITLVELSSSQRNPSHNFHTEFLH